MKNLSILDSALWLIYRKFNNKGCLAAQF